MTDAARRGRTLESNNSLIDTTARRRRCPATSAEDAEMFKEEINLFSCCTRGRHDGRSAPDGASDSSKDDLSEHCDNLKYYNAAGKSRSDGMAGVQVGGRAGGRTDGRAGGLESGRAGGRACGRASVRQIYNICNISSSH